MSDTEHIRELFYILIYVRKYDDMIYLEIDEMQDDVSKGRKSLYHIKYKYFLHTYTQFTLYTIHI